MSTAEAYWKEGLSRLTIVAVEGIVLDTYRS